MELELEHTAPGSSLCAEQRYGSGLFTSPARVVKSQQISEIVRRSEVDCKDGDSHMSSIRMTDFAASLRPSFRTPLPFLRSLIDTHPLFKHSHNIQPF